MLGQEPIGSCTIGWFSQVSASTRGRVPAQKCISYISGGCRVCLLSVFIGRWRVSGMLVQLLVAVGLRGRTKANWVHAWVSSACPKLLAPNPVTHPHFGSQLGRMSLSPHCVACCSSCWSWAAINATTKLSCITPAASLTGSNNVLPPKQCVAGGIANCDCVLVSEVDMLGPINGNCSGCNHLSLMAVSAAFTQQ